MMRREYASGVIRDSTFPTRPIGCAAVKLLHLLLLAFIAVAVSACASGRKKSGMHMYEGDSSPSIRMYDEGPGSELHN